MGGDPTTEPDGGGDARISPSVPTGQRWVLLEPPTAATRFWLRALAVALLAVSVVLLAWSPEGIGRRAGETWAVLGLALLVTVVGCCWLWVTARLPRPISGEVDRLLAGRTWGERRRLERALRHREPVATTDRPAAAALTARAQFALAQPGTTLTILGTVVVLLGDSATGVSGWLLIASTGSVCLLVLRGARRALTLQRAATRAGVAPLVADAPPPSPRIPGSSPARQR